MAITAKNTKLILLSIIICSFFLRFFRYSHRFVFNQDQARDTVMVMHALKHRQSLLLGSAASAGPFNFGPIYHYAIAISKIIIPSFMAPWLMFTLISSLMPLIFYQIGKNVKNQTFGLILATISCLSLSAVKNAPDMLNTIFIFYITSFALLFLSVYLTKPSVKNLFLLSFFVGLTTTSHFQSLGLYTINLLMIIYNIKKPKKILIIIIGSLLPYLPNFIFDLNHNFVWIKSVFNYYFSGQSIYYYPVRWLTDIFVFWPQLWGKTIAMINLSGYIFIAFFLLGFILSLKNIKKEKTLTVIIISFLLQIVLIRYYKGPRSEEYFFTFIAFFIFLTSWSIYQIIYRFKKSGKIIFIALVCVLSYQNYNLIITQTSQAQKIIKIKKNIETETNQNTFSFYTDSGSNMINMPLFYLLYDNHQITSAGYKIGTCNHNCPDPDKIITNSPPYLIYNLNQPDLTNYQQLTSEKIYNWLYVNY